MNSASLNVYFAISFVWGAFGWFGNLPLSTQWLLALWVFSMGACFGSFMNVVIYRVPAGLSVVYPGSRCPQCRHAIRGFDNLPIFSWLILRGRCRDCGLPFSIRYPSVEAFVAMVVLGVVTVDVFMRTGGHETWLTAACHVLLLCTLICASFIEFDGNAPPVRLFYPTLILTAAGLEAWRWLNPVSIIEAEQTQFLFSIYEAATGALFGAGFGFLLLPMARRTSFVHLSRSSLPIAFASCGFVMGTLAVSNMAMQTAFVLILVLLLREVVPFLRYIPVLSYTLLFAAIQIFRFQSYIPADVRSIESAHAPAVEPAVLAAFVFLVIASSVTSFVSQLSQTRRPAHGVAEDSAQKESAS